MPLLIDFKAGDKIIVNGAILENAGSNSKILVHNQAAILRGREVLAEEDAVTPASRAYFALQCAYIFADQREAYIEKFKALLADFVQAAPSTQPIADEILAALADDKLYKALKGTHKLIKRELEIFRSLNESVSKAVRDLLDDHEGEDGTTVTDVRDES